MSSSSGKYHYQAAEAHNVVTFEVKEAVLKISVLNKIWDTDNPLVACHHQLEVAILSKELPKQLREIADELDKQMS